MLRKFIQTAVCALALSVTVPALAGEANVPTTAAEHVTLDKQYQQKAAANHNEAQDHRDMAAAYKNSNQNSQAVKRGQTPGWVAKMEAHCAALAATADKLAADDEKAAEFHTFRAKEMEGK